MEIIAKLNYLRIAPRKVRLCADLIRGMEVNKARTQLQFSKKKAARTLLKFLNSSVANAKNNFNFNQEKINNLFIKKITVDEGAKLKRMRPAARGSSHQIQKKTSHITLILSEREKPKTQIRNSKSRFYRGSSVAKSPGQSPKTKIQNPKKS